MSEYIERETLKEMFSSNNKPLETAICSVIDATPAADVAPVVHGRWIEITEPASWIETYHCSECIVSKSATDDVPYCPNCGCKMDGGEKYE